MSTESKEKKESAACCESKEFKKMFEMMSKCCTGEGGFPDFSGMMKNMKNQSCCEPNKEKSEKETSC